MRSLAIGYVVLIGLCLIVVKTVGDVSPILTVLLFGPRYLLAVPLLVLLIGVIVGRDALSGGVLLLGFFFVFWGLMDCRFALKRVPPTETLDLMTLNVKGEYGDRGEIANLVARERPDCVTLQECFGQDQTLPSEYELLRYGRLTFATRRPLLSCPEIEHAFRGSIQNVAVYDRPLEANEAKTLSRARMTMLDDPNRGSLESFEVNDVVVPIEGHKNFRELQNSRKLKNGFTYALNVMPELASDGFEVVLDYGTDYEGGNVHRIGDTLFIGTWGDKSVDWAKVKLSAGRAIELVVCVDRQEKSLDVYVDGTYADSAVACSSTLERRIRLGTFRGTTRTSGERRRFPDRLVKVVIELEGKAVEVFSLHNPTARLAFSNQISLQSFDEHCSSIARWVETGRDLTRPAVVMGDLNLPVESRTYRRCWGAYRNAFSAVGVGYGASKRTRFAGISYGTRIDHILFTRHFAPICSTLGAHVGSDHLPVLASLHFVDAN